MDDVNELNPNWRSFELSEFTNCLRFLFCIFVAMWGLCVNDSRILIFTQTLFYYYFLLAKCVNIFVNNLFSCRYISCVSYWYYMFQNLFLSVSWIFYISIKFGILKMGEDLYSQVSISRISNNRAKLTIHKMRLNLCNAMSAILSRLFRNLLPAINNVVGRFRKTLWYISNEWQFYHTGVESTQIVYDLCWGKKRIREI